MSSQKKRQVKTYLSAEAFALLKDAARRARQPMTRVVEMLVRHHLPFTDMTDPNLTEELKSYRQPERSASHGRKEKGRP